MAGKFLGYYTQYTLSDLRDGTLSYGDFIFLLGAMYDATDPEITESAESRIARKVRSLSQRSTRSLVR